MGNNRREEKILINIHRPTVNLILSATIVLAALTCLPTNASAHAPQDIKLKYDAATAVLSVTITHTTFAPTMHYVKQVEIKKNGAVVNSSSYDSQPDKTGFTYTYAVPASPGDVIEVTGSCSIFGSTTTKLDVGRPGVKPAE